MANNYTSDMVEPSPLMPSLPPDMQPAAPVDILNTPPPQRLEKSRSIAGRLCLAGEGPVPCDIMIVGPVVTDDEVARDLPGRDPSVLIPRRPGVLKGLGASVLLNLLDSLGLGRDRFFYAPLVRYLLPKKERARPKKRDIDWCWPALRHDILRVRPKVVVAMGQLVFDLLSGLKLAQRDQEGGFFGCPHFQDELPGLLLYPTPDPFRLVAKPASYEHFRVDFEQVLRELRMCGEMVGQVEAIERHYRVIHNSTELMDLMREMSEYCTFSVDCEWHGQNFLDGQLRSMQFSWKPGHGAYVRFMDDQLNYVFDVPYREAGNMIGTRWRDPDVSFVGHQISADMPWIAHVLGIDMDGRVLLDTAFAIQTLNEHADTSLERLAMMGTDLGRYDQELVLWKKQNRHPKDTGYGLIPDDIMIPYAIADVDVPMRLYARLIRRLMEQNLWAYYRDYINPFCSSVFAEWTLEGMPMDVEQMDRLRELYGFAHDRLDRHLKDRIREAADQRLREHIPNQEQAEEILSLLADGDSTVAQEAARACYPDMSGAFWEHMQHSRDFNIRSTAHLRVWLFGVKQYCPVKSTGKPSIAWEKVEQYPPAKRVEFDPSTDKQTLQILQQQHQDGELSELMTLNAIGNIRKAFLKEPTLDDEGNMTRENGLHYWLASDGKIHGMFSTTETGRPRSWKPNILNLPSYVQKQIGDAIARVLHEADQAGELPEHLRQYYELET